MPSMPRVLLLNYEFPPMGGGAGHASFQIAKTLVALGCSVDVITSSPTGQSTVEIIYGVRIFRVPSQRHGIHDCGFFGAWSYVITAQPVFRKLIKENSYDVIHYFFGLPTGLLLLCTPGAGKIPSLVSLRGSDVPGYDLLNKKLRAMHRLLYPLTRRIWNQADAVVANSHALRELAQPVMSKKPIRVVTNAIEGDAFYPAAVNGHKKTALLRILTVARLIHRKGIQDLLHAMTFLKEEPVHLTIQGTGSQQEQLEQLALDLGIYDRVTFAGFCVREQLPEVYQEADVFVMPSLSESFSMAVLEAMASGLPIVASQVGGMSECVAHGVNGLLVRPQDPQTLAAAIRSLLHDAPLRHQMGKRSVEKAREQFSWQRVTSEYLSIYEQIIEQRNGNGVKHARQ